MVHLMKEASIFESLLEDFISALLWRWRITRGVGDSLLLLLPLDFFSVGV